MKVYDIKSWALNKHMPIKTMDSGPPFVSVAKPAVLAPSLEQSHQLTDFAYGPAALPEVYCAHLEHVFVIGNSDLLISQDGAALYDEVGLDEEGRYTLRQGLYPLLRRRDLKRKKILLQYKMGKQTLPEQAIHFCKDYSYNYFHWLIECLPRMWALEQDREYDDVPLLIDEYLPLQQLDALKMLTHRQTIPLKPGHAYRIKKLIYPSPLSSIHEVRFAPKHFRYNQDIVISPLAIHYLRTRFLSLIAKNENNQGKYDKIFISRKMINANQQRLANTVAIENRLSELGFVSVHPEALSFLDQVRLFAQAKVIVGAAGSAFANLAFVAKHCKVFLLCIQTGFNPYVFGGIATIVGCELVHVTGPAHQQKGPASTHGAFEIDPEYLASVVPH